ncbi:MAG: peroxidase family protein [Albidovulum sp.]
MVFVPLAQDDPLFDKGADGIAGTGDDGNNFMVVTRAEVDAQGITTNDTTPFIDQNQTYGSHASMQAFLREYRLGPNGEVIATGNLIEGANGGMATWGDIKAQARDILGIELDDMDVHDVPLLATDLYGNLILDAQGHAQMVTAGNVLMSGNVNAPIDGSLGLATGHAFLNDIAHSAGPTATADSDTVVGGAADGYDNELLDAHFVSGDGRVNENIGLTAVHNVFHQEHNRLVQHTMDLVLSENDLNFLNQWLDVAVTQLPQNQAEIDALQWNGERLFQAARFGNEMQYQHLVFEEFARKMQPGLGAFNSYDVTIDPSISAEFANVVYRFGHSMLNETVDRYDANFSANHIGLIEAFLNPIEFTASGIDAAAATGAIARGMTRQVGNAIDEFVTEALRNNLLGLPLDLATINMARGRDTGAPSLNEARASFFAQTGDTRLTPYISWADLAMNLKNSATIINLIAAYGTHADLLAATTMVEKRAIATDMVLGGALEPADAQDFLNSTGAWATTETGLNDVDLWIGGLAEKTTPFGGMLGSTFAFVFEMQLEELQNGDRFYYLNRLDGMNLLSEIETNTFAAMVMRNSDARHLPFDVFSTPAYTLEVDGNQFNAGLGAADPAGLVVRNDPATAGTDTNYLRFLGDDHVVLGGTNNNDTIIGGGGDDAIWGDGGNDRLEGGDGNDNMDGGDGDDIMTDQFGDDVLRGGNGNDVIQSGSGIDVALGGAGNDVILSVAGAATEIFAGAGDDFIRGVITNGGGQLGGDGNDWIEGGGGGDGDNGAPGTDAVQGHDVFVGDGSDDRSTGEGGDDIFVGSTGLDRMFGNSGFDWATYKNSNGVSVDLSNNALVPIPVISQRFLQVEGLSGSAGNDQLFGTDVTAATIGLEGTLGSALDADGIARIAGLQALLGAGVTGFNGGNIILGGGGSDTITARGGDDIIDGDQWLNVQISTGSGLVDSLSSLQAGLLSGAINPGQLSIVRSIVNGGQSGDVDRAVFTGNSTQYTFTRGPNGTVIITDNVAGRDGSDTLHNIEFLVFADREVSTNNAAATGQPTISDTSPTEGIAVTANTSAIVDPSGPATPTFSFQWQSFNGTAWVNIAGATLASFTPGAAQVNQPIRVQVSFQDAGGWIETVFSDPTTVVGDSFNGNGAANTFNGTAGDDFANGQAGNDVLNGNAGNDTLIGGTGADTLNGGLGADSMNGGGGNDRFIVDDVGDVVIDNGGGTDRVDTTLNSYSLVAGVEQLLFIGTGNFAGTGTSGANTITGSAGNDTLDGAGGTDRMVGGLGDDIYFIDVGSDVVVEAAGGGTDTMFSSATKTIAANVEVLTLTGGGNINATGDGAGNTLNGNTGNNILSGLGGADRLNGGDGDDTLDGGTGNDVLIFNSTTFGADRINGFDSNATGGQDRIEFSGIGITAANFSTEVVISTQGTDTLITTASGTILLAGISAATIDITDFTFS